jgi:hypothetical protein
MTKAERIEFFLHTRLGLFLIRAAELLAPVVGAVAMMFIIWNVETRFFPVIEDWEIERVEAVNGHLILEGHLKKNRACDLIATSVMAVPRAPFAPRVLIYQLKPHELLGGNAPTGFSTWGPWMVQVPEKLVRYRDQIAYLEVVGHHHCHALWHQETVYGRVPMERLPL